MDESYCLPRKPKPRIGSRLNMWFPGGIVVRVAPYTGRYKNWFTWNVTVTADNVRRGTMETVL